MNKLKNSQDAFTAILGTSGIVLSLENVNQVLNLLLLIISILNIIILLGLRLYSAIKNKDLNEVKNVAEDAKNEFNNIKEKVNDVNRNN